MPIEQFLTPDEVAARLRLSKHTLADWRCRQVGPAWVKVSATRVLYRESDLLGWIEQNIVRGSLPAGEKIDPRNVPPGKHRRLPANSRRRLGGYKTKAQRREEEGASVD